MADDPQRGRAASHWTLHCGGGRVLDLSGPQVMGILNITPDSFSDGGQLYRDGRPDIDRALSRARQLVHDGAALIDIGGESTRPGAEPISVQQELDRVAPIVEACARELDVVLSVDTSTPAVMRECAARGAGLINDIRALSRPGALAAAAESDLAVCLMHMQGEPQTMQRAPHYEDVVSEVTTYLIQRAEACMERGIARQRILLDPGIGFGKTAEHNLRLLNRLHELAGTGWPLLLGVSRKSLIGAVTGRPVRDRLAGSLALATIAVLHGARILRVHDVRETVDAVRLCAAVRMESHA